MAPRPIRSAYALGAMVPLLLAPGIGGAQHAPHHDRDGMHVRVQAVPLLTRAAPTPGGAAQVQAALTQAIGMARGNWWGRRLALDVTLDAEGLTMPDGELSLGAFGEGFADRRHPHTYLHELIVTAVGSVGALQASVSAGRGFAPFGTDDPMVRPFAKYPVNHHLAQVLERGIVMAALRLGPVIVEGGTFTGEEPERPSSLPAARRFGDSWAVRGTLLPLHRMEIQSSYARLASPEQLDGLGLDQRKQSLSARLGSDDGARYALAEWARTVEHDPVRRIDAFAFESALLEARMRAGRGSVALRLEQTERPEDERSDDPFRTARPHTDLHIIGITRWRSATLHVELPGVTRHTVSGVPFLELSRLAADRRDSRALFDPGIFYGGSRFWMATAGVRLGAGSAHSRMGRYGASRAD